MVSRRGQFADRAVLYIGLPALTIIGLTIVAFAVLGAVFTMPAWGYYVTGGFVGVVAIAAGFATTVAYAGSWIGGLSP